jgi:cell division protein FtsB
MKKIGFPFRYLRILFKIVSYVKRIEDLEKNNLKIEKELSELKKQWFSGKV